MATYEVQFGADILHRSYEGSTVSHPIQLLAQDGTIAETINFQGPGVLQATDTEVSGYAEDRWTLTKAFSVNFGGRLTHQSIGREAAFAPRAGVAFSMPGGKVVFRAGTGLIYGHVPMLAADFAQNQQRVITFSAGPLAGQPITLQNVYQTPGSAVNSSILMHPNSSPRTFTWNTETEVAPEEESQCSL